MLAVRNAIAQLQAGAQELNLTNERIGDAEAAALATVLATNTTLGELKLYLNRIGPVGARALAAALDNTATLTSLDLDGNNIGAEFKVARGGPRLLERTVLGGDQDRRVV
jgi:Ran GTPase-activating protein (RanGAP) involved in mRNA processing and transport